MNILKKELKEGIKSFILWSIALFFIMFAGLMKYTGFSGEAGAMKVFETFPKIILAVFGIIGVDLSTIGGFYAIIIFYGIICISIYAISLGYKIVNHEMTNKTYEFLFTKPRSRTFIFNMKMLSAFIYISLYSLLNSIFSIAAIAALKLDNTIEKPIILFTISMWMIGILFCMLSALLSTLIKKPEKGLLIGNLVFVATFIFGMIFDMFEKAKLLRFVAPLKYFLPNEVLSNKLDTVYVLLSLILSVIFYITSIRIFSRKDFLA